MKINTAMDRAAGQLRSEYKTNDNENRPQSVEPLFCCQQGTQKKKKKIRDDAQQTHDELLLLLI